MEVILGALFLYGIWRSLKDGGRVMARHAGAARRNARTAAAGRGGKVNQPVIARRAARQATAGWWAGEVRHGFPSYRHGFGAGLDEHRRARTEWELDAAKRHTDHMTHWWQVQAEIRRLAGIRERQKAEQDGQGQPAPQTTCIPNPPLADGQTPGSPPVSNGRPGQPHGGPAGNGSRGSGPMTADTSTGTNVTGESDYEAIGAACEAVKTYADHAANDPDLEAAKQSGDGLSALVPSDQTAAGLAADFAAAIEAHKETGVAMGEAGQSLHDHVVNTYEGVKEWNDSHQEELPEQQFVDG